MPLIEDRVRALERRVQLPEGNPVNQGAFVTYQDTDEDGDDVYVLTDAPEGQIVVGNGDPNTAQFAPKGTLFIEQDAPALWQNTDGQDTWTPVIANSTKSGIYDDAFATTTSVTGVQQIDWPTLDTGDALLDLTSPSVPLVLEDGYYTFDVQVRTSDTTDIWQAIGFAIHAAGPTAAGTNCSIRMVSLGANDKRGLSFTCPLLAGDSIGLTISTAGTHSFALGAVVSKIG